MANGGNRPNRPLRPRGGGGAGGRRRRVVIDQGAARPRDQRQARPDAQRREPKPPPAAPPTGPVSVESGVSVRDLSQALGVPMPEIIKILMGLGQMRTATQSLSDDEVELIATEVKREITIKHAADEEEEPEAFDDPEETLQARPPVVTIMGHVDHGKTTLLDAIRNARVVATEAGGITQHIGAYQVDVDDGRKITFLDTPGHEAFTAMRARGAKVTDIAVLVVAADDGVMPQTKESIAHARAAEVPIVVAVNKIDLADANVDRVKGELAQEDLQPEDWGGTTQFAEVSAKTQQNLDDLLEKVLLVADLELEGLKANPDADASGPIIESRLDVGRGPVATMLVQRGTLRVGDAVVAGDAYGRVKALFDYKGERRESAAPGEPIEILGFDKPPAAGELARVVENDREARDLANRRGERLRREQLAAVRPGGSVSLEGLYEQLQAGEVSDLNLIVRGDVVGSVEAVVSELSKFEHPEVRLNVIAEGVGAITQNDIMLASASDALIVGFNVRPNAEARELAAREGVEIRTYDVIYKLTEEIEQALVGKLAAVTTEETIGEAEVRALFRVSRLGTIAGCMVTDGIVRRNASIRVIRDGAVIYTTTIAQLKRFKDDVREVAEGFECGILLDGFNDVKEGDVLEVFETREVERTSLDEAPSSADCKEDLEPRRSAGSRARGAGCRAGPLRRASLGVASSTPDVSTSPSIAAAKTSRRAPCSSSSSAMSRRCMCGAAPSALSQSPPAQSTAAFARVARVSAARARAATDSMICPAARGPRRPSRRRDPRTRSGTHIERRSTVDFRQCCGRRRARRARARPVVAPANAQVPSGVTRAKRGRCEGVRVGARVEEGMRAGRVLRECCDVERSEAVGAPRVGSGEAVATLQGEAGPMDQSELVGREPCGRQHRGRGTRRA